MDLSVLCRFDDDDDEEAEEAEEEYAVPARVRPDDRSVGVRSRRRRREGWTRKATRIELADFRRLEDWAGSRLQPSVDGVLTSGLGDQS